MKTILVPTEPNARMRSTLETALLVAREFNSYIEGFAVRVALPNVVAMDAAPSGSIAFLEEGNAEAARQSRELFESFMQERGVFRSRQPQNAPTYGWRVVDLVGHRGRVFDLIVIGAAERRSRRAAYEHLRGPAVRKRPSDFARPAYSAHSHRPQRLDRLELQHGTSARHRCRHAFSRPR